MYVLLLYELSDNTEEWLECSSRPGSSEMKHERGMWFKVKSEAATL